MKSEFELAAAQIAADKGLTIGDVIEAVRVAVESAYLDLPGSLEDIYAEVDTEGSFTVFANKTVVEKVSDPDAEIDVSGARELDPSADVGGVVRVNVTPSGFSRIAAQKAGQAMRDTLREAERMLVRDLYTDHVNELMVGKIVRIENRGAILEFGRAEALLPPSEQISSERLRPNSWLRVLLLEVREVGRGPQLLVSRRHPDFVRKLFEREVPEINNGVVHVVNIARDAGVRSKVAVQAMQEGLDPIGTCVGIRGSRIQNIVRDLVPEKVEIVQFSEDPATYVANALSPARSMRVVIDPEQNLADVQVASDMVSLAIGREGQNSRLAARLTGWRINIRDAAQPDKLRSEAAPDPAILLGDEDLEDLAEILGQDLSDLEEQEPPEDEDAFAGPAGEALERGEA